MARYAPVKTVLDRLGGADSLSILDVGCGPVGLSCVAPTARFAGCDVAFPTTPPSTMVAVQTTPGSLPFLDRSFDVVVCLDVLEHIPPDDRRAFVADVARVAAGQVLIAAPSDECLWIDDYMRSEYELHGHGRPDWLNEHIEFGLPTVAEIDAYVTDLAGMTARPWAAVNGWLAALIAFGDVLPVLGGVAAMEWDAQAPRWLELLQAAEFGDSFRKGFSLERDEPSTALVERGTPVASVVAAVRCEDCRETFMLADARSAVCRGCSSTLQTDERGIWIAPPRNN